MAKNVEERTCCILIVLSVVGVVDITEVVY